MGEAQGYIQIYTGEGKGKTTASIGQGVRAAGHGLKVLMIQFMKGREYGELKGLSYLPTFQVIQSGREVFVDQENPDPLDIQLARSGLQIAREAIQKGEVDLLILDELNVALYFQLISLSEVITLLKEKKEKMHIIITGRNAPKELQDLAHLVSYIQEVKHHYQDGVKSRKGIEY